MTYLLDTNSISEFTKTPSDPKVMAWFGSVIEDDTYLSVGTLAEIRMGIENRAINRHGVDLEAWLTRALLPRFSGRILGVDTVTADLWGRYTFTLKGLGRPDPAVDALIGATAVVHEMVVVTRNERDFAPLGVPVLNPWTYRA